MTSLGYVFLEKPQKTGQKGMVKLFRKYVLRGNGVELHNLME